MKSYCFNLPNIFKDSLTKGIILSLVMIKMILWSSLVQSVTDCNQVTEIATTECQALLDLYNQTDGQGWIRHSGWNETNTPCSWDYVTCSGGHVTELESYYNHLGGYIPDSIGQLSQLKYLNLAVNQLSGSIPDSIGQLSQLTSLYLQYNNLSRSIPNSIGQLNQLKYLYLDGNQLSGSIPDSIGQLSQLTVLDLRNNQLSGPIPDSIGQLSQLQYLRLYNNQLSGEIPTSIIALTNLNSGVSLDNYGLDLRNNYLTLPTDQNMINFIDSKTYYDWTQQDDESPLPSLGEGSALNAPVSTSIATQFFGGLTIEGNNYKTITTVLLNEHVNILGKIEVDIEHIGKQANLLVVGAYRPFEIEITEQFYYLTTQGKVVEWNLEPLTLEPYQVGVTLQEKQGIEIYQGHFLFPGYLRIFFGYQLEDGTIVFNGQKTIDVVIE